MSHRLRGPRVRAIVLLAVPLMILVGVLALGTGTAAAHASVVSTDPADGSVSATAPSRVSITFTESVSINAGGLVVRNGAGERVDDATATAKGAVASTGLRPGLPNGTYVVTYRVLSADGHPVSGSFLFGVGSGELDRSLATTDSDRLWDVVGDVARGLLLLAALTAAGVAFFLRFVHDGAEDRWRLTPFVRIGTVIAFFAAIGAVIAQAALLTGRGAGASTDTEVLRQVLNGDLGLSLAVLFVGLAVVHLSTDIGSAVVARVLALYGGLAVTISFALWGHATAFTPAWLLMSTDAVHATAAAVWL
ncbi:MAG: copper resistance protein CopC, partial [Acidimicrobiia bacterium]